MQISVIICTHNPRPDYLRRTLDALKAQTLPKEHWELLLIDNASKAPLADKWDLSWHPAARYIREDDLGLTPARLHGIQEAKGELLVFVDDDNLLSEGYLQLSLSVLQKMTWLGAIGGQIIPQYETHPPDWLLPYERVLAIRRAEKPRWSNSVDDWQSQPWGAGMVVRSNVCQKYLVKLQADPVRGQLGRKGTSLISGEDTDLILTSLDLALGFGVFPDLVVTHLIPPQRMTKDYILKITRGLTASNLWLAHLRGDPLNIPERRSLYTEARRFYHYLKISQFENDIELAQQAGWQDYVNLAKASAEQFNSH